MMLPASVLDSYQFPFEPTKWDFVLSCAEPLSAVTGGIGTYSRLLIEELSKQFPKVLLCTPNRISLENIPPNVSVIAVSNGLKLLPDDRILENLPDELLAYSFHLSQTLLALNRAGHEFENVEFPDYGNDGYFSLALRKSGALDLGKTYIRLHSPHFMLRDDNLWPPHLTPTNIIHHSDAERFSIMEADTILYGGEAMLERVLEYFTATEQKLIRQKVRQVPHPWPTILSKPDNLAQIQNDSWEDLQSNDTLHIGIVGRLEIRKGTLKLLEFFRQPNVFETAGGMKVRFHFLGAATTDWTGRSLEDIAREQVWQRGESDFVKFHGKIDQSILPSFIQNLDGLVYPSLFENYPNALLEAMQTGKPVMVSQHGCMPFLVRDYPDAIVFDPNDIGEFVRQFAAFATRLSSDVADKTAAVETRRKAFEERAELENATLARAYRQLGERSISVRSRERQALSVSFIVPHYNHSEGFSDTLHNLQKLRRKGDAIIVVDDKSDAEQLRSLKKLLANFEGQIELVESVENAGPGAAREKGVQRARTDAIQFLDADDLLDDVGFDLSRRALEHNPEVAAVWGYQDCFGDRDHIWVPNLPSTELMLFRNFAHSAPLVRKSALTEIGGYPTLNIQHYEDWLFNLHLAFAKLPVLILPVATQKYRTQIGISRSTINLANEHVSYAAMIREITQQLEARSEEIPISAWLRSAGRTWLIERGMLLSKELKHYPRRYQIADIIMDPLMANPVIRKTAMWLASSLIRR